MVSDPCSVSSSYNSDIQYWYNGQHLHVWFVDDIGIYHEQLAEITNTYVSVQEAGGLNSDFRAVVYETHMHTTN